jgi:hypothetical protein
MTNYIKHAKTLTLDQWRGEICSGAEGEGPLWNDIVREMDSFPQRDPMRSLVEQLCLESDSESICRVSCMIHGVAVSEDFCSFPTTVYFYGWTEPYQAGRANIIGAEPFEVCRDVFSDGIDRDTYFIRVEAVLRINDDAQMSSEIVEACADPYSIDLEVEEDGSLFAYAGL